jgi:DNA-binding response OmpR family regulator
MTEPRRNAPGGQQPAAGGRGGAALADLRHDLVTPINHVLGYSELLLEEAGERGLVDLLPGLEKLHGVGKELLARVNEGLDAARGEVGAAELRMLSRELCPLLDTLLGEGGRLLGEARRRGAEECASDLGKVLAAAGQLILLSGSRLLPAAPPEPADATGRLADIPRPAAPVPSPTPAGAATAGRILVVDDSDSNRDMLRRRLERQGYTVATAENGRQALAMLRAGGFDLVLLDVMMPEVDGYQVLQEIKASPELRDLPVVMISALDEIASVVRCIEMGAEDYLPKPFDPVLLQARVGACLEQKRLRDHELDYLRNVAAVTAAAAAVEGGAFDPGTLESVAARGDSLGQLARVFQRMAREVQAREQRLRQQVQELRVQIDETRKARQVAEITETDYFQSLQQKARDLRRRVGKGEE